MKNSYGEIDQLTQVEKIAHTLKVLCEWPSAREQLKLENMYDPKSGINLGDKLWTNQQFSALKVYNNLDASTEDILEKVLEREGTLDLFSTETSSFFPIFSSNNSNQMKLKKNCNGQLKIMALQKSIDAKYNFWNKEHLIVLPAYGTKCLQARSII